MAERVQLIQARQLDLELQSRAAQGTREGHKQAGFQALCHCRIDLAPDQIDRAVAIDRFDLIRKPSEVHALLRGPPRRTGPAPLRSVRRSTAWRGIGARAGPYIRRNKT